jgi:hypothetical protein
MQWQSLNCWQIFIKQKQPPFGGCHLDNDLLSADQGKNGNAKCKQSQNDGWDPQPQGVQAVEQKEQDQTPGRDRIRESHFPSPLKNIIDP